MVLKEPISERTYTHNDAVAPSFRMLHVLFWFMDVVIEHLYGFSLLNLHILLFDCSFHKMLMCNLAESPPEVSIVHDQHVMTPTDEIVEIGLWPIAVYGALLVD